MDLFLGTCKKYFPSFNQQIDIMELWKGAFARLITKLAKTTLADDHFEADIFQDVRQIVCQLKRSPEQRVRCKEHSWHISLDFLLLCINMIFDNVIERSNCEQNTKRDCFRQNMTHRQSIISQTCLPKKNSTSTACSKTKYKHNAQK